MQNTKRTLICKILTGWIIFTLSCYTNIAWSKDCTVAVPVFEGEIAGCTGIMYPEYLVEEHLLLRINTNEQKEKLILFETVCNKKILICKKHLSEADSRINKISNPPFYKTPAFGFFSGILFTIGAAFSIFYTLK